MSFDLEGLRELVEAHGKVARVVVVEAVGSTPREAGAFMVVWPKGQVGTIGGGTLEHVATMRAHEALESGEDRFEEEVLGPGIGQCCGGRVSVLTEVYDAQRLASQVGPVVARPLPGVEAASSPPPIDASEGPVTREGWWCEPLVNASRPVWVWGAGHVGRALVPVLAPLPQFELTWIDVHQERFPPERPRAVTIRTGRAELVVRAPPNAEHLILTHSHRLDFEICEALLEHDFGRVGLIGSKTKAARFRSGLSRLGFGAERLDRIRTPIGDKRMGKHPQAVAIAIAADLLLAGAQSDGERLES